jgi:hypothetical protein
MRQDRRRVKAMQTRSRFTAAQVNAVIEADRSGKIHLEERDYNDDTLTAALNREGYDYRHQAWVVNGKYQRCGHGKPCDCYGTRHHGEPAAKDADIH